MRGLLLIILVILVGCGGDDDCCTIDAPPVDIMLIDSPMLPATHHHFVIDKELVPTTNTQAREYGLDLNGDMTVDNQLGMVLSTLAAMGFPVQAETDRLLDTGAAIMLVDLGSDDLTTESTATFTIYQGMNPTPPACASAQDTICRKHFTGSASFQVKPSPIDPPLLGMIAASKLTAGPGHLTIQLTITGGAPLVIPLIGARVEFTTTTAMGKLAGAVTKTDLDTKVLPQMRDAFAIAVMRDCIMLSSPPACGCAADTTGKTLLGLFDVSPKDCAISLAEVQNNSLLVSLFAPDVTVEGVQALSLGVGFHAVAATFVAP
jgi:hypothetical protein